MANKYYGGTRAGYSGSFSTYQTYDPTTGKMAIMSKPTEKSYDPTTGEMATMNKPTEISYDSTTGETAIVANKPKNRLAEYLIKRRKKEQEEKKRKEAEEKAWREAEARDAEQKKEAVKRAKVAEAEKVWKEAEARDAEQKRTSAERAKAADNYSFPENEKWKKYENAKWTDPDFKKIADSAIGQGSELEKYLNASDFEKTLKNLFVNFDLRAQNYMTQDEKNAYNYAFAKGGQEAAYEYIFSKIPIIKERAATEIAKQIENEDNPFWAGLQKIGYNAGGGYIDWARNTTQAINRMFGNTNVIDKKLDTMVYDKLRANMTGAEGVAHDVLNTGVQLLPGVALGYVTGGAATAASAATSAGALAGGTLSAGAGASVGAAAAQTANAAVTGTASFGRAYSDARNEGKTDEEAVNYASLSAAGDMITTYALNGIRVTGGGKVSNAVKDKIIQTVDKVAKTPAGKKVMIAAGKHIAEGGGEAFEEYLQTTLNPIARNIAFGENNEVPLLSEEQVYSAFMGFVVSEAFNAPSNIADAAKAKNTAKTIQQKYNVTPTYNPGETVKLVSGETARVTQRSGQYYIIETQQGNAVAKNTDIAEVVCGAAQDRANGALGGEGVGAAAGAGSAETGIANGEGSYIPKATTIKNPYGGVVPTQNKAESIVLGVSKESIDTARAQIDSANAEAQKTGKSSRNFLTKFYNTVFDRSGGARGVIVDGVEFDGKPYVVMLNKNVVRKVVSDHRLSAEKLALFNMLDDVVESGNYVGSGDYLNKSGRNKEVIRYDYFETPVTINGQSYIAAFDVEVLPASNRYRTHRIINEIDLVPTSTTNTPPVGAGPKVVSKW